MADPLSPNSVLKHMADALPTRKDGDTGSDISSSYEAIALFCHSCFVAVGFRLLGYTEDRKNESEFASLAPRLTDRWNASFGSHSFLYAHSQSAMQFLLKVDRMGSKAEIRGIGLGDERIARFEITARDFVSSSALPLRMTVTDSGEDRTDLPRKLKDLFISESRIKDLASLLNTTIIQKLVPNIHKEGYENPSQAAIDRDRDIRQEQEDARRNPRPQPRGDTLPEPARPYPFNDPLAQPSRGIPVPAGDFPPPGFEDEYEINRPPRGLGTGAGGLGMPGRSPFNIGHDDLNPPGLGPHDPLRGSFGVGGGGLPRPGGGSGMYPSFDDPLFAGQGGQGANPHMPPGARYDPVGPGDGPQRGAGGRPPNPFNQFGPGDII